MRQIFFFFLLATTALHGQNYYAGNPVYDTLISSTGGIVYGNTPCPRYVITFDPSMTQDPAGTQVYFKITSVNMPANTLYEINHGALNLDDSLAVTPSDCSYQFYAYNTNADFHFAFLRCGTPVLQGDSFTCSNDISEALSVLVDGCGTLIERNFYPAGADVDSCAVNGPLAVSGLYANQGEIEIYPVPVQEKCFVQLSKSHSGNIAIEVMNIDGRIVCMQSFENIRNNQLEINTDGIATGIYMVRIRDGNSVYTGKMVKE